MRRLTRGITVTVVGVGVWCLLASVTWADPASCSQYDSNGICIVQVQTDGSSGETTSQPATTGTSDPSGPRTCSSATFGTEVPCQSAAGWWVASMECYVQLQNPQPSQESAVWGGRTDGAIYFCSPYLGGRAFPGTGGFPFWSATDPAGAAAVDPAVLAQQALSRLTIPAPTTGRYPAGTLQDGRPFTVVNAYTWFWTDSASFQSMSARASTGGVWADVTVTPTSLSFTPGDGAGAVSCRGPGTAWQLADGVWAPSPVGCDYRYPNSSLHQPDGEVTATYAIHWTVTWTASTGATGTLPQLTTTSDATFAVAEAQAVVTR